MPKFQYTARNLNGGRVSGQIEAEAVGAASRLLENRDLFPIDVWDVEDNESANSFRRRIASRDLGIMYGQLSDLLGSGVPLLRALKSLVKSTVNKLADVLREIHNEVATQIAARVNGRSSGNIPDPAHGDGAGRRTRQFPRGGVIQFIRFLERLDELRSKVLGALVSHHAGDAGTLVMIGA